MTERPPGRGIWDGNDALQLGALVGLLVLLERLVLDAAPVRALRGVELLGARSAAMLAFYAVLIGVLSAAARRSGHSLPDAVGLHPFHTLRDGFDAVVVALGGVVFEIAFLMLLPLLGIRLPPSRDVLEYFGTSPAGLAVVVALGIVIGPIVEEMLFRGAILEGLSDRFGERVGVVGSALLFALVHFEVVAFVPLAVLGVLLARLRLRTGSLLPTIIAHASFNAIVLAISLGFRGLS